MTRPLRVGSLFAGYGGLTLGVCEALGLVPAESVAWHSEIDPDASRVLDARFPGVPNIGDIAAVDWSAVEPVDVIDGGSPCQDMSSAGSRQGMRSGTRSGLWSYMRDAIAVIRPSLVVWENVRGATSACADSDLGPCPRCVGEQQGDHEPVLRALGRVLGDLADIGFDAEWVGLQAADVGAPHPRYRVFVCAWPTAADARGEARNLGTGLRARLADGLGRRRPDDDPSSALADAGRAGLEGGGPVRPRAAQPESFGDRAAAADASGDRRHEGPVASLGDDRCSSRTGAGDAGRDGAVEALADAVGSRCDGRARTAGRGEVERAASAGSGPAIAADADGIEVRLESVVEPGLEGAAVAGHSGLSWGDFEPAIRRWERVLGRPAPDPTVIGARGGSTLSPYFDEWLMGVPAGWITDIPGISARAAIKMCGNGVVPQQAAEAIVTCLERGGL